jgi:hypothetical protein
MKTWATKLAAVAVFAGAAVPAAAKDWYTYAAEAYSYYSYINAYYGYQQTGNPYALNALTYAHAAWKWNGYGNDDYPSNDLFCHRWGAEYAALAASNAQKAWEQSENALLQNATLNGYRALEYSRISRDTESLPLGELDEARVAALAVNSITLRTTGGTLVTLGLGAGTAISYNGAASAITAFRIGDPVTNVRFNATSKLASRVAGRSP